MSQIHSISDHEFLQFQRFIFDAAGITMSESKKALVSGRLAKRLQQFQLDSYGDYFRLLKSGTVPDEVRIAVDLLTTNETYFFREPKHFDVLAEIAANAHACGEPLRVWSAASSTGEEAYTIAMVLADAMKDDRWEVVGSDISTRVLARARVGHYPMERATHIPPAFLKRYCLKGMGQEQGTLLVDRALRSRVQFMQVNLNETLPQMGKFDVIFLRNVMIYFNTATKRQVVERVLSMLKPGGYFFIGHSESLHGVTDRVQSVMPSVYRAA